MSTNNGPPRFTVSQLTTRIRDSLETQFLDVIVFGEVSSLSKVSSAGHRYCNLTDGVSVLQTVLYRSALQRIGVDLCDGLQVIVRGRISVYVPKGEYQLIVEELHATGAGEQELALRRLKERLRKLGYFAADRKRRLPVFPRRIAVVASPIGAAIRDILETLRQRWPAAEIWVCGVRVQGAEAPESIAAAFARLNQHSGIDVVILGRGGGSSDDLSAFNDERVAHAVFRCRFPVVAAIGHEVDVTIVDLVADHRALTPTGAATAVCPDREKVREELRQRWRRLRELIKGRIAQGDERIRLLLERRVFRLPIQYLRDRERELDEWSERLQRAMQKRTQLAHKAVEKVAAQLESLSPLAVLARGYSLTRTLDGASQVVRSVEQVQPGDAVEIILHDGRLTARVESRQA